MGGSCRAVGWLGGSSVCVDEGCSEFARVARLALLSLSWVVRYVLPLHRFLDGGRGVR